MGAHEYHEQFFWVCDLLANSIDRANLTKEGCEGKSSSPLSDRKELKGSHGGLSGSVTEVRYKKKEKNNPSDPDGMAATSLGCFVPTLNHKLTLTALAKDDMAKGERELRKESSEKLENFLTSGCCLLLGEEENDVTRVAWGYFFKAWFNCVLGLHELCRGYKLSNGE